MRFEVVTLFPDLVRGVVEYGVTGRAHDAGLIRLNTWNPRDYARDRHRSVDGRPFGGGPGMVMKLEPLREAIRDAKAVAGNAAQVIYLSPQGRRLDQTGVRELSIRPAVVLVCGRYEGIDERVIETEVDAQWSIGDYVLSGGELAAMVLIDALTRLLPGALGDAASAEQDSYMEGLLDYPHYTRPEVVDGLRVPHVLLSGDHGAIRRWRAQQALGRTRLLRPDLLAGRPLTEEQQGLLDEFIASRQPKRN